MERRGAGLSRRGRGDVAGSASGGNRHSRATPYLLSLPALAYLAVFFVIPLWALLRTSLSTNTGSVFDPTLSFSWAFSNYGDAFSRYDEQIIAYGASPRASLGLLAGARALALLRGRSYALPQDVFDVAPDVLRHRLVLSYEALAQSISADQVLARVLSTVPAPRIAPSQDPARLHAHQQAASAPAPAPGPVPAPAPAPAPSLAPAAAPAQPAPAPEGPADTEQTA